MSRLFYHTMQDNLGNLLFGVSGTMRLAGTGTLATIYGDEALTIPIPNPMTNHASYGSFKCYLGAGSYDFSMAKAGYSFETLTGLQGWGTMALQNANAVAISGGTVVGLSGFSVSSGATAYMAVPLHVQASVGISQTPDAAVALTMRHAKATQVGIVLRPNDSDTGQPSMLFQNLAGGTVGSITTTGAATAFNTSSDGRLKDAVAALTGALAVVHALRPVQFRWKVDGSPGHGFLAQEVAEVVDGVVSGEPDAVDADGRIVPMQMDASKLVPYLVGAVQMLLARVETLEARLA